MRGVTERQTDQYNLGWWKELAFRLGRECGCGLDSVRDRRTDDDAPNASEYPLTLAMMGTKDIAAPLLARNASLQYIRVFSAALGGLRFMEFKDEIRNLLCTNASSVRTASALFLSVHSGHIRIRVDGRGCRTNIVVACFCRFIDILRSWRFRVTVSLVYNLMPWPSYRGGG